MINIKTLLPKDENIRCYQIQGIENNNKAEIKYIGDYTEIPLCEITKFDYNIWNCQIVSFLVSEEELKKDVYLKMISILFYIKNNIVMSLDMTYSEKSEKPFNIILTKKNKQTIIKSFETFMGNQNIVNILIEQIENIDFFNI